MRAEARTALLVFVRAPVPGEAKTRLIPRLGAAGASALHACLTHHTLATAMQARVGAIELWCSPTASDPFFIECERRHGVVLRTQSGADLGERLALAAVRAF